LAAEVTNKFAALEAPHDEVTPEDLWKGTKTVLLEVARKKRLDPSSRKRKRNEYLIRLSQQSGKREKQKA